MSGLILCTKQADEPLYVENGSIRIFNLEELCYYLFNYTYMITIDFFDENFLDFCEKQIEQPSLAQKVKEGLAHKEQLKNIILKVLESSSYYSEDEMRRFEGTLAYLDSSSVMERLKARADMMVKAGKLKTAYDTYQEILKNKEEVMSLQFYARVRSNIGVIYTKLFMYEEAVKYFEQAYADESTGEYRDYLICSLMMMDNRDELYKTADKYGIEMSLIKDYEKAFSNAKKMVRRDEIYNSFVEQFRYSGNKNLNSHYEQITDILSNWKEDYRKAMEY